ncbi:hypothetical protein [Streptococcus pneumoniae]|uniref:hypothetical protein n=1 Tax=Streptococcus pneumoniae TaxID=1313 RepID=UPI00258A195F|nr:hypothetical protein [Streptococcus pneumoniae]
MRIKEQTRKLAAGCSKHCFEVVDRTDEVSNHIYGNVTLTWSEEIFEEYDQLASWSLCSFHSLINQLIDCSTFCLQNLGKGFLL